MRLAVCASVLWAALPGTGAHATETDHGAAARRFIGLWEGVDPGNGSLTQRSITCNENQECTVLGSDSFFSLCDGGQGILKGTGTVDGGVLDVPGFTLTCSNGVSVSVDATFTPARRNGTLVEQTVDPNIAAITLHRLSRPLRPFR